MDIVRPFAGPLFRSYRGLTEVPELAPSVLDSETRVGVNFCLSMMKLNNLQQYRTVRYLPLNDGGYGALHIAVTPGQFGQPLVRSWLEVKRAAGAERKKVWRKKQRKEPVEEGLFIINNRWLLEPDPGATPSGTLVGQVGDWRLFDTGGKVFKPGKQYNGFCTQSTDGKTQHAVWIYEDEAGKKWIAQDGALPYVAGYNPPGGAVTEEYEEVYEDEALADSVSVTLENGALISVPPEAQAATIGCWFWYADNMLMGSYTSGALELALLEAGESIWSPHTLAFTGPHMTRYGFPWTPGYGAVNSMNLDGTQLVRVSSSRPVVNRTEESYAINFKDKSVVLYSSSDDPQLAIGWWKRESQLFQEYGGSDQQQSVEFVTEPPGTGFLYEPFTGPYPETPYSYLVFTAPWEYYEISYNGFYYFNIYNATQEGFPYFNYFHEKANNYIERQYNGSKDDPNDNGSGQHWDGIVLDPGYLGDQEFFGTKDRVDYYYDLGNTELGILYEEQLNGKEIGSEDTWYTVDDYLFKITLNGELLVPSSTEYYPEDFRAISAVTTDLCALCLYQAGLSFDDSNNRWLFDVENPRLFGILDGLSVDLTELMAANADFKADILAIGTDINVENRWDGYSPLLHDHDIVFSPATRGSAFPPATP